MPLPVGGTPGTGTADPPLAHGPAPGEARTALVVAPDEGMRTLLRGLLRLHRYRIVGEAGGGREAARLLRAQRPALVLIDDPGADDTLGGLVRDLRRELAGTRVVLIRPRSPRFDPARRPGADVLLPRPFRLAEFAEAIEPSGPGGARGEPPPAG